VFLRFSGHRVATVPEIECKVYSCMCLSRKIRGLIQIKVRPAKHAAVRKVPRAIRLEAALTTLLKRIRQLRPISIYIGLWLFNSQCGQRGLQKACGPEGDKRAWGTRAAFWHHRVAPRDC